MVDANSAQQEPAGKRRKERGYFVNGEQFVTDEPKLTVRAILENAGFTPAEEYRLTRDNGHHVFDDYETEVPIHDGERFTATFLGPTPTS
ncbi:hypothetical protein [Amycolatopsis sp. lyj-23]|uniref:hypothetical protein n=1 Tax=Amycolatopsis sp. lyj-23 TaxID=2789283 RepID=UPI00397885C0